MSSEHKDMFFNIQNLYNFVVANTFVHRGGVEPARSLVFRLLSRRTKTASTFKQFFSSPSLVLKLSENFVIEMQFLVQWFRKEQLETEITIVRHLQPKAGDPAFVDFVQKMTGWIPALRARMTEIKNSHEQSGGKCIPSPRGRAREGD